MKLQGKPANLGEDLSSFRNEVATEIACEEKMVVKLQESMAGDRFGHVISFILILFMVILIFLHPEVVVLWLIIAILLYSYNFIILMIPTTTESIRPDDQDVASIIIKERKWFALRLLLKKRKLAIEIGLTVLLGGIIPLALSFSVIFGIALFFAVYVGFFVPNIIPDETVFMIGIQITLIILFYIMMLIIKPQAQGITKIGRSMKVRIQAAKARGKAAYAALILMIIGLIAVAITLVFGAMLLPGFLLPGLFEDLKSIPLSIIALVFISQLLVMRHFQVIMSRRMAMKRLKNRLKDLNDDVLVKLDALESAPEGEMKEAILEDLKSQYYSIAIYDLIEQDFFGYSPIYLFGLRLRYILDEDVLAHINVAPKGEEPKKGSEGVEPANEGKVSTDLYSSLEHWMFSKDVHESLKNWKLSEDLQAVQELWKISIEEKEEGTRIEMHSITIIKHLKE